jgi:creatinine amidohydrolase
MPARPWRDLTTEDFRTRAGGRTIAVLPLAAVEQHGPHLPLGTDAMIAGGYLDRFMPLVPDELDVLILPIQSVGLSTEHGSFPGTLSLAPATALAAWTEIGASVALAGCRKLVLVTSHGGNSAAMDLVAGELRARHSLLAVTTAWRRFGAPESVLDAHETKHGIHAGEAETSLMLALRPDLVRMDLAQNFVPRTVAMERDFARLSAGRPAAFAWMAEDLHPAGATGNAAAASAEKGHALLDYGARAFVELLREVDRFELEPSSAPRAFS